MGRKTILVLVLLVALFSERGQAALPDLFRGRVIHGIEQVRKGGLPPLFIDDDASLVSTATPEGRLTVFDDAWETIQERYYDPAFHGVDWQAKRNAFRAAAGRAANTQEFYELLRQMIAS